MTFEIPSFNLPPLLGFSILISISIIFAFLSYGIECIYPLFESTKPSSTIIIVRFIHIFICLLNASYIYVFDSSFDIEYIIIVLFVFIHWSFTYQYDCILNNIEKLYYEYHCVNTKNECRNIYIRTLARNYTNIIVNICGILTLFNFCIVVIRLNVSQTYKSIILVSFILYIVLYFNNQKQINNVNNQY